VEVDLLVISRQPVKDGLLFCCLLLMHVVWCPFRGRVGSSACTSLFSLLLPSEASCFSDERRHLVVEEGFSCFLDNGGGSRLQDRCIPLVHDFNKFWIRNQRGSGRDGVLEDLQILLAVQEQHGVKVGNHIIDAVRGFGREEGDNTERWEGLEIFGSLTATAS
jgi:hypothetical protein